MPYVSQRFASALHSDCVIYCSKFCGGRTLASCTRQSTHILPIYNTPMCGKRVRARAFAISKSDNSTRWAYVCALEAHTHAHIPGRSFTPPTPPTPATPPPSTVGRRRRQRRFAPCSGVHFFAIFIHAQHSPAHRTEERSTSTHMCALCVLIFLPA